MFDLVKKYEGLELKAYRCPAGVWTIGYGSTRDLDGKSFCYGDTITKEKAERLLQRYYDDNCVFINNLNLTDKQEDALFSLIYNIGRGGFLRSGLYKAILNKDAKAVFKNWDWISVGGKVSNGLIKRRAEELALFTEDFNKGNGWK